jgi:mannose-6-phosphate isomerase-like protein (cupin superfamily)
MVAAESQDDTGQRPTEEVAMSFKLAHRAECETIGNWKLVRRTLELESFGVNIVEIGSGEQIPEHDEIDRDQEEVFLVLGGDATLVIDGEDHAAPTGTLARLDPEHKRTVRNDSAQPAEVLIVSAPRSSGYQPMSWA